MEKPALNGTTDSYECNRRFKIQKSSEMQNEATRKIIKSSGVGRSELPRKEQRFRLNLEAVVET